VKNENENNEEIMKNNECNNNKVVCESNEKKMTLKK